MNGRLTKVSPSRVNRFQDCPRAYRHHYLDRPAPPKDATQWAHQAVGNGAHLALADWWDLTVAARTPAAAAPLVAKRWQSDGFRDGEQSRAWQREVTGWVTRYLATLDPAAEPRGIERTLSAVEGGMTLEGKADRVDERGGHLRVVDYKTGKHAPTDDDAASSPALAVYVLGAQQTLRRPCWRAELHHLPTGTAAVVVYDEARLRRQIDRLASQAQEISELTDDLGRAPDSADDLFPTKPGPLCSSCAFRRSCPDGQGAPELDPWAYLPELKEVA